MTDIDTLRSECEQAEARAQAIMAEKDAALDQVRDQYRDDLRAANDEAAAAQKALCDAEAASALRVRYDEAVEAGDLNEAKAVANLAENLGLHRLLGLTPPDVE